MFVPFRKPTEAVSMDSRVTSFSPVPRCSLASLDLDEDARMMGMSICVKGSNTEAVLVFVTVATNTGLDMIASWRSDGRVSGRIDCRGERRARGVG